MAASSQNIWEMAAKIDADFSQSDRAMDQNARKVDTLTNKYGKLDVSAKNLGGTHGKLSQQFSGLQQTINATGGPLNNVLGKFGGLISTGGQLAATTGGVGVALGLVASATVGAIAGIYSLTTASAELTGKFFDLSQQTGFQVETLSALGNALETSGGDIESAAQALFLFETKMGDAKEKGSEMSKMFQTLGIDTTNHEKALRQALTALEGMTDAETKATIAKQLFGRSAKQLLGALAEAGSLDAYLNKQLAEGTLITTKAAKQGDELSDTVTILGRRFTAAGRVIAEEFTPMVVDGLRTLSKWLVDNQGEIRDTAREIVKLVGEITSLANFIWSISPLRLEIQIIRKITEWMDFGSTKDEKGVVSSGPGGQSMFDKFRDWFDRGPIKDPSGAFGPATGDPNATQAQRDAAVKQYNDRIKAEQAAAAAAKKQQDAVNKMLEGTGKGGGRGGGGGKDRHDQLLREQKQFLDASLRNTIEGMEGEEAGVKRSYEQRRLAQARYFQAVTSLEVKRHEATIETINQEIELAKKIKDPKKREIELLDLGTQKQREMNRHAAEQYRISQDIKQVTRDRIVLADTLISRMEREREVLKQIKQERSRFKSEVEREDLGGGSFVLTPEEREKTQRSGRVVTVEEQVRREQAEIFRDKMRAIASDLTFIIDDALREGFDKGIKHGIISFGLGILEMARHAALKELEKALADVLGNVFGGSSGTGPQGGGGGWLSKLIGFGVSAIAGLFGGASTGAGPAAANGPTGSGIGNFAEGGFMRPFEWAWVGERGPEKVRAGYQGVTVLSSDESARGGGNTYNITMPIHVPNMAAAGTRETQFQVRRALAETVKATSLRG